MNKEVIYLEPEDDITDILTKLQQAEQKLVALVPPKKATMLRSAVNMKLVARVAKECDKVAVIVTADPAIVKMAMAAKIPVAKTLQSRPVVPTPESVKASELEAEVIDENGDFLDESEIDTKVEKGHKKSVKAAQPESAEDSAKATSDTLDLTEEGLESDAEGSTTSKKGHEKSKKDGKNKSLKVPSLDKYRKWIIAGVGGAIVLAVLLVWALVFAPAVTITVAISSTASNFAESIRFTTDPAAENLEEGILFVERQTFEEKRNADFEATGEEDHGDKATGTLTVTYSLPLGNYAGNGGFSFYIPTGETFTTTDGLKYRATSTSDTFRWDGEDLYAITSICDNRASFSTACVKAFQVPVEAVAAGEDYNIKAGTRWESYDDGKATVSNSSAISGGTTDMVTTVSQKDVDEAKDKILKENEKSGCELLLEDLNKDLIPIKDSCSAEASEETPTPAIGEEVGSHTTPNLKITAIYAVYAIERAKIEEYIQLKTSLPNDQKIYSIGDPYFERFSSIEDAARLKTVIETGPTVTEESIREKAQGRKTGEVQSLLRSINGVSSVEIRTSYFWVWSVPTDPNKVTINLTVEDR